MTIFLFKSLLQPIKNYFYLILLKQKLKREYSSLKLSGDIKIKNTKFGCYNYIENATIINSSMGDFSYVGSGSYVNFCSIGKFCCIGPNVKIGLGSHPTTEFISVHPVFYSKSAQVGITFSDKNYFQEYDESFIGNDVWIGANVVIKSGISIGDGAIIASGSVVTKNVLPYSIMGGVPSVCIKMRFEKEEIDTLLDLKWWNRDISWLKSNYMCFHSVKNLEKLRNDK